MKKYNVVVREVLSRGVEIEADSPEEAEDKIHDMYAREEIVLNADDFLNYDISVDRRSEEDAPVQISIVDGVADVVTAPDDLEIEIHDYDSREVGKYHGTNMYQRDPFDDPSDPNNHD